MRQWILMWCDVLVNLIDKKGWLDCFVMCLLTAYWWVSKDQSWQLTTHLLCYRMILYNKVCFQCRHQVEQLGGVTVLASVQCLCEALML